MMTAHREGTQLHTPVYTHADTHSYLEAFKHEIDTVARESARHQQRKNSFTLNTVSQKAEVKYFLHT